jgi:aminoglycoside 2'-N-acetyltransferase I
MKAVTRFTTAEASPRTIAQLRQLFFAAFDDDFTEQDWEHVLGGWHVVAFDRQALTAHAAVVPRVIDVGTQSFRTGYVEGVATDPSRQGAGFGTKIMNEVAALLHEAFEFGALSTGAPGFYERLGWRTWRGPTYVRYDSGLLRTEAEDGGVMVLPYGPSRGVDLTEAISCRSRTGDDW